MRIAVLQEDRTIAVEDAPPADVGPADVRVDVAACGVCGSDLHFKTTPAVHPGAVFGHEYSGVISEIGAEVSGLAVGDHVACWPAVPCGECAACDNDQVQLCQVALAMGIGCGRTPGAFAESIVMPAAHCIKVPDSVPLEHIALAEPLAVAMHAVNLADIAPDEAIVISGGGPIGLMTGLCLTAKGHDNVVVIEPNEQRRDRLAAMGLRSVPVAAGREQGTLVEEVLGSRPSLAFECAGHEASLPACFRLVAPGGQIVVAGMLHEPVAVSQLVLISKELRVLGSFCHTLADFAEATDLLVSGQIPADQIITAIAPLEDAERVFGELTDGGSDHIKVMLRP